MNNLGNWVKIYDIVNDNSSKISVNSMITSIGTNILDKRDFDNNKVYSCFKVQVENSSGLLNLSDNELTI